MFRAKLGLVRFFRVLFSDCVPVLLNDFYAQRSGSAKTRGLFYKLPWRRIKRATQDACCSAVWFPCLCNKTSALPTSPDGSGTNKPRPRTKPWKTDIG